MDSSNTNGLCKPVIVPLKGSRCLFAPQQHTQTVQVLTHIQCRKRQPSCLFQASNDLAAAREGCCAP
jgi:hypothetical protein